MDQLIRALEVYTSSEVDEKWLYELAELYHKAGIEDKCVATCDRIMLLFGLGKYVDKAMDLKLQYAPLNKYQMDLVENRGKYEAKLRAVEEEYSGNAREQDDYEGGNSRHGCLKRGCPADPWRMPRQRSWQTRCPDFPRKRDGRLLSRKTTTWTRQEPLQISSAIRRGRQEAAEDAQGTEEPEHTIPTE